MSPRGLPPPPPNNAERAKKKRGRPPKQRPDDVAHLPPPPEPERKQLVRADGTIDGDVLLDLFLANVSPDQAQALFGVSPDNYKGLLGRVSVETLTYVEQVLDQLTLKNIARVERLMATWLPLAQDNVLPTEKGAKVVIDLIRLERDLLGDAREEIKLRTDAGDGDLSTLDDAAAVLERQIESTFSKGSPMYEFAQSVLTGVGGELVDFTEAMVTDDVTQLLQQIEDAADDV